MFENGHWLNCAAGSFGEEEKRGGKPMGMGAIYVSTFGDPSMAAWFFPIDQYRAGSRALDMGYGHAQGLDVGSPLNDDHVDVVDF